jgi:nitronate monooxygenase
MDPSVWPDTRLLELLGIEVPIIQAPMAGAHGGALASAVSEAGGLGSLPCALLDADQIRGEFAAIRSVTSRPVSMNFFCHAPAEAAAAGAADARWRRALAPYYAEWGLDADMPGPDVDIRPFGAAECEVVEALRPDVVSFHFGLPDGALLERVRATGARVLSSATTVDEARWLADHGCDAVIAQGAEAGGHRAMFLAAGIGDVATQMGTFALVPQVVDAVDLPVIAAGGIADGRGVAAAFVLGASGVQIGTAYLLCPESQVSTLHAASLREPSAQTALTNVFTGRPARSIVTRLMRDVGPMCPEVPPFPRAAGALLPLRAAAEQTGDTSFTSLWSGQAAGLARALPAGDLTRSLAAAALERLRWPSDTATTDRHPPR